VLLLALVLSAPWGRVMWQAAAPAAAMASASETCPDCDEGCLPGQMVRSGCASMCAFTPAERIVAVAPTVAEEHRQAPLNDLGLGGLRPRPEPAPPRLHA
jgi:hypothetical protein